MPQDEGTSPGKYANGFGVVPVAVLVNHWPTLSKAGAKLLVAISSYLNTPLSEAYPGRKTLMRLSGIRDKRTFQRALAEIKDIVQVTRRAGKPHIYKWKTDALRRADKGGAKPDRTKDTSDATNGSPEGPEQNLSQERDRKCTQGGAKHGAEGGAEPDAIEEPISRDQEETTPRDQHATTRSAACFPEERNGRVSSVDETMGQSLSERRQGNTSKANGTKKRNGDSRLWSSKCLFEEKDRVDVLCRRHDKPLVDGQTGIRFTRCGVRDQDIRDGSAFFWDKIRQRTNGIPKNPAAFWVKCICKRSMRLPEGSHEPSEAGEVNDEK